MFIVNHTVFSYDFITYLKVFTLRLCFTFLNQLQDKIKVFRLNYLVYNKACLYGTLIKWIFGYKEINFNPQMYVLHVKQCATLGYKDHFQVVRVFHTTTSSNLNLKTLNIPVYRTTYPYHYFKITINRSMILSITFYSTEIKPVCPEVTLLYNV